MASGRRLAWAERLAWMLIFGGLATLALGLAARNLDAVTAWALMLCGGVLAAGGIGLIWVRSRMHEDPAAAADIAAATPASGRASHNEP